MEDYFLQDDNLKQIMKMADLDVNVFWEVHDDFMCEMSSYYAYFP